MGTGYEPTDDEGSGMQPHDEAARFAAEHGLSTLEAERIELGRDREARHARCLFYLEFLDGLATRMESGIIDKVRDARKLRNAAQEFRAEIAP